MNKHEKKLTKEISKRRYQHNKVKSTKYIYV